MDIVTILLAVAAIATLGINARQLALQTKALRFQTVSMDEDRAERMSQRQQRRTALFDALKAELREIQSTAEADYDEYRGEKRQTDRERREGSSVDNEGLMRHRLGFPWSHLPDNIVAQAISETALLSLKPDQVEQLLMLRSRIQRVNTLAGYKVGLYPALMLADIRADPWGNPPWVAQRASHLNNALEAAVYPIVGDCKAILDAWRL